MRLVPLGDRVVVEPDEDQDMRTPSGLVIPDTAKEKPQMGKVVAVGPGRRNDDGERMQPDVSEGDKVLLLQVRRYRGKDRWDRIPGALCQRSAGRSRVVQGGSKNGS